MVGAAEAKINGRLYENAILYFIKYCNNKYLHMTKLNKLLYYFDFISFRDHKAPATGDIYTHQEYGPVPTNTEIVLSTLKAKGLIDAETAPYKDGELISFSLGKKARLDESVFSAEQKKLLKQICDEFGSWSTEKIVAQTHLEAPWFYSKPLEVVDYAYARDIDFFRA